MKKEKKKEITLKPDPIVIPEKQDDTENDLEPRASKFINKKTGHPSEEWLRMNELLFLALDYSESMPFTNDIIRLLGRCYISHKAGKSFSADALFDRLSMMSIDPHRRSFRKSMGEKLDEYLLALAKKSPKK